MGQQVLREATLDSEESQDTHFEVSSWKRDWSLETRTFMQSTTPELYIHESKARNWGDAFNP